MPAITLHIQQFLDYIAFQRQYSPRTLETYQKSLQKYLATLPENAPLENFSTASIRAFVWKLRTEEKLAPTSIGLHIACLKSFGKFMVRTHLMDSNPAATVPIPKRPQRLFPFYLRKIYRKTIFQKSKIRRSP
jgi:integrase/recombinase XerC/integrase/recombinase XerD